MVARTQCEPNVPNTAVQIERDLVGILFDLVETTGGLQTQLQEQATAMRRQDARIAALKLRVAAAEQKLMAFRAGPFTAAPSPRMDIDGHG